MFKSYATTDAPNHRELGTMKRGDIHKIVSWKEGREGRSCRECLTEALGRLVLGRNREREAVVEII